MDGKDGNKCRHISLVGSRVQPWVARGHSRQGASRCCGPRGGGTGWPGEGRLRGDCGRCVRFGKAESAERPADSWTYKSDRVTLGPLTMVPLEEACAVFRPPSDTPQCKDPPQPPEAIPFCLTAFQAFQREQHPASQRSVPLLHDKGAGIHDQENKSPNLSANWEPVLLLSVKLP